VSTTVCRTWTTWVGAHVPGATGTGDVAIQATNSSVRALLSVYAHETTLAVVPEQPPTSISAEDRGRTLATALPLDTYSAHRATATLCGTVNRRAS
jgi:hypothetical protein